VRIVSGGGIEFMNAALATAPPSFNS
jgi:hypothetical protein